MPSTTKSLPTPTPLPSQDGQCRLARGCAQPLCAWHLLIRWEPVCNHPAACGAGVLAEPCLCPLTLPVAISSDTEAAVAAQPLPERGQKLPEAMQRAGG